MRPSALEQVNTAKGDGQMIAVSVLCPRCGERLHRIVHEDCPPLSLQCVCGAAFPLAIEREPARDSFPHNSGEQYGVEDEHEAALNTKLVQMFLPDDDAVAAILRDVSEAGRAKASGRAETTSDKRSTS